MKCLKVLSIMMIAFLAMLIAGCDIIGPIGPGVTPGGNPDDYVYKTPATDKLKLTTSWEGRDFLTEGIGAVTVNQNVDGDTTIFKANNGYNFTVRYLGVNTPESTYKVEPWGFAAADFTKGILKTAETIVLEADGERTDGNGRYLAWVWYRTSATEDFRLLNLEIIENGFSASKGAGTKYAKTFLTADESCQNAKVRIWGQVDPKYDASVEGVSYTIKELREQFSTLDVAKQNEYKGKKVIITGIVTRQQGAGSAYIQQYDETTRQYYNVYVYGGYSETIMKMGYEVYVQGTIGYYNGSLQITSFDAKRSGIIAFPTDFDNPEEIYYKEITVKQFNTSDDTLQGQVVVLKDLTVTGYRDTATSKAFSIFVKDAQGNELEVRVPEDTYLKADGINDGMRIDSGSMLKGLKISSITGVVGWYSYLNSDETQYGNDGLQLVLVRSKDITFNLE